MRVLIKIVIAALVIHGAWRVGSAFWRYYQFQDALQEVAQFGDQRTDRQLCDQAAEKADTLGVPITPSELSIRRGTNPTFNCETGYEGAPRAASNTAAKISISGQYKDPLQILPGYKYPWEFKPAAEAWIRP